MVAPERPAARRAAGASTARSDDAQLSPDGGRCIVDRSQRRADRRAVEIVGRRARAGASRALHGSPKTPSIARFSPDGTLFAVGNRTGQTRV